MSETGETKVRGPYAGYMIVIQRPTKPIAPRAEVDAKSLTEQMPEMTVHAEIALWLHTEEGRILSKSEAEQFFRNFVAEHKDRFPPFFTFRLRQVPVFFVAAETAPDFQTYCGEHGPKGTNLFCERCGNPTIIELI